MATDGWISLNDVFREYARDAAQWMTERDKRLASKKRDEPKDGRRRGEPDDEAHLFTRGADREKPPPQG